jgi:hypothetical protein
MKAIILSLAICSAAGAAYAQAAAGPAADSLAQAVVATPVRAALPDAALNLSMPHASRYAQSNPLPAGIARTSIDHRFEDDGAVGSAGYLCGLQPGEKMYGAAGAAGYDPMGKFLGAKLSVAFR